MNAIEAIAYKSYSYTTAKLVKRIYYVVAPQVEGLRTGRILRALNIIISRGNSPTTLVGYHYIFNEVDHMVM